MSLMAAKGSRKWHLLDGNGMAGCGRAWLGHEKQVAARRVDRSQRCQAPGCAEAWPPVLRSVG